MTETNQMPTLVQSITCMDLCKGLHPMDKINIKTTIDDLVKALDEAYAELAADSTRDGPRCLLLTTIEKALAKAGAA